MANFFSKIGEFFTGKPQKNYQISTLGPEQQSLKNQLVSSGMRPGAGGAFGTAADYYRNLLSDNSSDMNAFAAPEMRQFREQLIPDLAEQFAGMGSGALSSSGFRNASVNAATDLSERLGAIRAQLRQQGAAGLQNIGSQGLQSFYNNVTQPATPGLLDYAAQGVGSLFPGLAGDYMRNRNSSPYGRPGAQQGALR